MKIIDVGCGPANITSAIAKANHKASVVAIDISIARIKSIKKYTKNTPNVSISISDAYDLPFKDNSFDIVFSRFLLQFIENQEHVIKEMVRVCRPGGRVILQELDGQLLWHYPVDYIMEEDLHSIIGMLNKETGFDPFAGRKLFHFLKSYRFENIDVKAEIYHFYAGRIDEENFSHWKLKMENAKKKIKTYAGGKEKADRIVQRFLNYLQNENTLTYSVVFTVTGIKP